MIFYLYARSLHFHNKSYTSFPYVPKLKRTGHSVWKRWYGWYSHKFTPSFVSQSDFISKPTIQLNKYTKKCGGGCGRGSLNEGGVRSQHWRRRGVAVRRSWLQVRIDKGELSPKFASPHFLKRFITLVTSAHDRWICVSFRLPKFRGFREH